MPALLALLATPAPLRAWLTRQSAVRGRQDAKPRPVPPADVSAGGRAR